MPDESVFSELPEVAQTGYRLLGSFFANRGERKTLNTQKGESTATLLAERKSLVKAYNALVDAHRKTGVAVSEQLNGIADQLAVVQGKLKEARTPWNEKISPLTKEINLIIGEKLPDNYQQVTGLPAGEEIE